MRIMKRSRWAVLAACIGCAVWAGQPQEFDGVWSLDRGRSTGLPPGMELTMTIARDEAGIQVKTSVVTDFGDRIQEDRYVFDGAEHDAAMPGIGNGTRTARRLGDRSFSSIDHLKGPNGETTVERAWSVAEVPVTSRLSLTAYATLPMPPSVPRSCITPSLYRNAWLSGGAPVDTGTAVCPATSPRSLISLPTLSQQPRVPRSSMPPSR